MTEPTIYDLSSPGRTGVKYPESDVPEASIPEEILRDDLPLPELSRNSGGHVGSAVENTGQGNDNRDDIICLSV